MKDSPEGVSQFKGESAHILLDVSVRTDTKFVNGVKKSYIIAMETVLFTRKDSIYKDLGCNCYDIDRDARSFKGKEPVIAHPPCRAWGKLKGMAKPLPGERELTFLALKKVNENGGMVNKDM
jgi:hypothetical protein